VKRFHHQRWRGLYSWCLLLICSPHRFLLTAEPPLPFQSHHTWCTPHHHRGCLCPCTRCSLRETRWQPRRRSQAPSSEPGTSLPRCSLLGLHSRASRARMSVDACACRWPARWRRWHPLGWRERFRHGRAALTTRRPVHTRQVHPIVELSQHQVARVTAHSAPIHHCCTPVAC
jgi:hypothetical protein